MPSSSIARRLSVRLYVACALAVASPARAEAPRVVVMASGDASALLRESLVRAQGELSAVGLGADVVLAGSQGNVHGRPGLRDGVYGLLKLEQRGSWLWIHAWAPGAPESIDARVNLAAPGVSSEVIAVRAVETLRAAMLQFAEAKGGAVPEVVRGFTRFAAPAPAPAATQTPPRVAQATPRRSPPLAFWAGSALSLHPGVSPDLGAQLGVLVGPNRAFLGAAFETTLGDLHLVGEHGSADVRRQAAWLQAGVRFRPASAWEVATRAGAGYAAFNIRGAGEPGYHGIESTHGSLALMLGVSFVYWATRAFGLYASVGGRLATDAPTVLIAEKQAITLDRPSYVLSLGASVGVF